MAISRNYKAFNSTNAIANTLKAAINEQLDYYNVVMHIEAITSDIEFWNMIKGMDGQLTTLTFEIIKPNMSNISGGLAKDLKDIVQVTNSHKTIFQLNAPENSTLEGIDENNIPVKKLVDYATQGGGTIKAKRKGNSKIYSTRDNIRMVEEKKAVPIEEMEKAQYPSLIKSVLSKILAFNTK